MIFWAIQIPDWVPSILQDLRILYGAIGLAGLYVLYRIGRRMLESSRYEVVDNAPTKSRVTRERITGNFVIDEVIEGTDEEKAAELVELGRFSEAIHIYLQLGETERAANLYLRQGNFNDAARMFKRLRHFDRAALLYEKAGVTTEAAENYKAAGNFSRAADLYRKIGDNRQAADCIAMATSQPHSSKKKPELAISDSDFVAATNSRTAAPSQEVHFSRGSVDESKIQKLIKIGRFHEAAELYRTSADPGSAAPLYEKGSYWVEAAECYKELQLHKRAAECLFKAELDADAIKQLKLLSSPLDAGGFCQEVRQFYAAGRFFEQARRWNEAMNCYARVTSLDKNFSFAIKRAVQLALKLKQPAPLVRRLEAIIEMTPPTRENLKLYQLYGAVLIAAGEMERANAIYDELLDKLLVRERDLPPEVARFRSRNAGSQPRPSEQLRASGQFELAVRREQAHAPAEPSAPLRGSDQLRPSGQFELAVKREQAGAPAQTSGSPSALSMGEPAFQSDATLARPLDEERRVKRRSSATIMAHASQTGAEDDDPSADKSSELYADLGLTPDQRYQLIRGIGEGGAGEVFLAIDQKLARQVVIKFLKRELTSNETICKYFLQEARVAASMNHRNIVTIHDVDLMGDRPFISMEYLKGETLESIYESMSRQMSREENSSVISQLCDALIFAHSRQIVHRDIKAENIMLIEDDTIKLMDFGVAKVLSHGGNRRSIFVGTPVYMAPEMIVGQFVDHRVDIYAVGVLLYLICTGQFPFEDDEVLAHHVHTAPPDPRSVNPQVGPELAAVILKCLAKKREERFVDVEALKQAVLAVI